MRERVQVKEGVGLNTKLELQQLRRNSTGEVFITHTCAHLCTEVGVLGNRGNGGKRVKGIRRLISV